MRQAEDLSEWLGAYRVARQIDDYRAGQVATFEGTAEISASARGAIYREAGQLQMAQGAAFRAERVYLWAVQGPRIAVFFEDGRPFHDFDPRAGGATTEHLCGQDWYRGGYNVSGWPDWQVTWEVTGPRKDYRSVTRYLPLG
ncbi:MAG: hypothetical protein KJP02_01365 [Octadecabacter sp.]|nr:hypothetical protein [Octadecabacter sp.]